MIYHAVVFTDSIYAQNLVFLVTKVSLPITFFYFIDLRDNYGDFHPLKSLGKKCKKRVLYTFWSKSAENFNFFKKLPNFVSFLHHCTFPHKYDFKLKGRKILRGRYLELLPPLCDLTLKWSNFSPIGRISELEKYVMFQHQVCLFSRNVLTLSVSHDFFAKKQ
jgi:hypothetical protein